MRQQVNLYLPEFKVKKDALTPVVMAQIVGGVLAVFVILTAYDVFTRWRLESELSDLQVVLDEETRKTSQLDEQLARRSQNTALTNRLEAAEARLEASRQISSFLSETQLGNVAGFSEYFKDLSRASIEGLSVTEFSIENGGRDVMMAGQVLDSAMVPRFVDNIEMGQSPLRDKHFSPSISKAEIEDEVFSFVLSSSIQ